MRYPQMRTLWALNAFKSDGTLVQAAVDPTNGPGVTLGVATYLFPLGGERYGSVVETVMHSLSAWWPAGITGSITIEGTNFPQTVTGAATGGADVTDWDIASAKWQQINPTLSGAVYANASGGGSMAAYTCTVTNTAGGALWNIPDMGMMRLRARFAVTGGGFCRFLQHSKLGS